MASKTSRALQTAIALMMMVTAIGVVTIAVPGVQATTSPDLTGGFIFNVGPQKGVSKFVTFNATSTLTDGERTVSLAVSGSNPQIQQVLFWADRVGSAYIKWNPAPASAATGFTGAKYTDVPNPPVGEHPHDELLFTGGQVPGGVNNEFRLSFSVIGNPPEGTVFNVNVTAIEADGVSGHRFNKLPALKIVIDNTPPAIRDVEITDVNADGHLDLIVMRFTDYMDLGSFHLDQLNFTRDLGGGKQQRVYQPLPGQVVWDQWHRELSIGVAALPYFDTGDMPDVTYRAPDPTSAFTDAAGNRLANKVFSHSDTIHIIDRARPVLVSALGYQNSAEMVLTFSEPIRGTGQGVRSGCPLNPDPLKQPTKEGVALCDLQYNDGATGGPPNNQVHTTADFAQSKDPAWVSTVHVPLLFDQGNQIRFGKQDVSFVAGDTINVVSVTGSSCPSRTNPAPPIEVFPKEIDCTAIYDRNNNTVVFHGDFAIVKVSSPQVIQAEVNIDSFKLTLEFNSPVSGVIGNNDDGSPIQPRALDIITTTGGAPGGIDRIIHEPGTALATVVLDKRVLPTDVDATPSYIQINCDPAKGAPSSFIKSTGLPDSITVPCGKVPLVDRTQPAILHAGTIDRDSDGYIDGYALEFNEPVNDASFCMGVNPCPSPFLTCNNPNVTTGLKCTQRQTNIPCTVISTTNGDYTSSDIDNNIPVSEQEHCTQMAMMLTGVKPATSFTFLTGEKVNDRFGLLVWPEIFNISVSTQLAGTNPHTNQLFTGFVPDILTFQYPHVRGDDEEMKHMGLFTDMVSNGTTTNFMGNITDARFKRTDQIVTETDTAPPVVMVAETTDSTLPPEFAEGNGYLDSYRLTLSEAVRDSTFTDTEWKVGSGHRVTGYHTGVPSSAVPLALLINDNVIYVDFDDGPVPDTDLKPDLSYSLGVGPSNPSGLKDLYGNPMRTFTLRDLALVDRARPVIVDVIGFPGQDWITVNMSEPVDNGLLGPLTWDDMFYSNWCRARDDTDASGRLTGPGTPPVQHKAGSRTLRLPLNKPLTNLDLGDGCNGQVDTINSIQNETRETAPSLPPGERQAASTNRHAITMGVDTVRPGEVTGFGVDVAAVSANSASFHWTAPGDDNVTKGVPLTLFNSHGKVTGYTVKISTSPFGAADARSVVNPPGLTYTYVSDNKGTVGLADPGLIQTLVVTGLAPTRQYYISVAACDERMIPRAVLPAVPDPSDQCAGHRNVSNFTNADADSKNAVFVMDQDVTPPVGDLTISSTTHRKNTPTPGGPQGGYAAFNWTPLTDGESTVVYAYALTSDPTYEPSQSADKVNVTTTPGGVTIRGIHDGTWTFSVRGFSGGGQSRTAHYTIKVGFPELRPADIRAANRAIITTAIRERGVNIVNWTLPPKESLPNGAVLQGLQIWRLDDGKVSASPVCTPKGNTYEALEKGSCIDETAGATADSAYRVDMVFQTGQTMADASKSEKPQDILEGFQSTKSLDRAGISIVWVIVASIIAALLVVGIVVLIVVARKRAARNAEAAGGAGYVYQASPPAATDASTGLPIHDVRCPSCSTEFQAQGHMPLQIACPNCGVAGILQ